MYTKFHDNTIQTKFIKALVAQTHTPTVNTWTAGDFVVAGATYISKDFILKCNYTGRPNSINDADPTGGGSNYFTVVDNYIFGRPYFGITSNYLSSYLGYDAKTHYYLGNYLRAIRDFNNVNLMPFYNCFCGEYLQDIYFDKTTVQYYTDDRFKILSVPVKFGKNYTIALNSDTPVTLMCVIYGNKGLLYAQTSNLNDTMGLSSEGNSTFISVPSCSFGSPLVYATKTWEQIASGTGGGSVQPDYNRQTLGQYEKYLRLLIRVPVNNESSVVVLEGDYSIYHNGTPVNVLKPGYSATSGAYINTVNLKNNGAARPVVIKNTVTYGWAPQDSLNPDTEFLSPLGLLQVSDKNIYAFSDRLIEYLLLNVIDYTDSIQKNTERIQDYATSAINKQKNGFIYSKPYTVGVLDESLREYLYNLASTSPYLTRKIDLTGFIDRDVESVITRGQKV